MCYFISMSNINWSQFSNNFSGNFNRVSPNNVQNMPLAQELSQPAVQQQNTSLQNILSNVSVQLSQTSAELASLNQQQTINMLKDLMNFSKNFEQLISQLTTNTSQINNKTALMLLASNMNFGQLSSLLQNNSKEAVSNLYQMLAQYNQLGVSIKDEQLNIITKMLSFVAASSSSDVQSLKTTMLMYLPWLPLTDPDAFKLEITEKNSQSSLDSDDSITILMSTENYGNIKADIYKTSEDGIKINFVSSLLFPNEKLNILMKEESKKYSININITFEKKESFNKQKNEESKTQVTMNTSPGVNPFLLIISNTVIKNIHNIDIKANLCEQRKEKLDGKSKN